MKKKKNQSNKTCSIYNHLFYITHSNNKNNVPTLLGVIIMWSHKHMKADLNNVNIDSFQCHILLSKLYFSLYCTFSFMSIHYKSFIPDSSNTYFLLCICFILIWKAKLVSIRTFFAFNCKKQSVIFLWH